MYFLCVAILKLMQKLGDMICGERSKSSPPHASFLFTKFTLHALGKSNISHHKHMRMHF